MNNVKGLIGFSTSDSLLSRVVRWFRDSEYSHTFIVLGRIEDTIIIGEADFFRVRLVPIDLLSINKQCKIELWKLDVSDDELSKAINKIMSLTNRRYGVLQIAGLSYVSVLEKIGIKVHNPFHGGIICSEYVYYFLKEVGIDVRVPSDDVTPDQIYDLVTSSENSEKIAVSKYGDNIMQFL